MWMNLRKHNIEWKEGLGYKQHETLSIKLKKKIKAKSMFRHLYICNIF